MYKCWQQNESAKRFNFCSVVLSLWSGASDDWAKGAAGIKYSYTIELPDTGRYNFLLPPSRISGIKWKNAVDWYSKAINNKVKRDHWIIFRGVICILVWYSQTLWFETSINQVNQFKSFPHYIEPWFKVKVKFQIMHYIHSKSLDVRFLLTLFDEGSEIYINLLGVFIFTFFGSLLLIEGSRSIRRNLLLKRPHCWMYKPNYC